jgi:hypothetical protein
VEVVEMKDLFLLVALVDRVDLVAAQEIQMLHSLAELLPALLVERQIAPPQHQDGEILVVTICCLSETVVAVVAPAVLVIMPDLIMVVMVEMDFHTLLLVFQQVILEVEVVVDILVDLLPETLELAAPAQDLEEMIQIQHLPMRLAA